MSTQPPPIHPHFQDPSQNYPGPKKGMNPVWIIVFVCLGLFLLCCIVTLPIMLLPAVMQVREAARMTTTEDRAHNLGLAIVEYENSNREFPPAFTMGTMDRTKFHSWRTRLLPQLGQDRIYRKVDLSVAWDQAKNFRLNVVEVPEFKSPRATNNQTSHAHFVAVVGPNTLFRPNGKGVKRRDVRDGVSNTIMLIEYPDSEIPWFKPEDVTVDQAVDIIKNSKTLNGIVVVFADGHTQVIDKNIDEKVLRGMFTINGGEL
jgi:hypothetical protein